MTTIHPTAQVDPRAVFGKDNYIGPFCVIGPGVTIGNGNRFESHCVIGAPPEHRDYMTNGNVNYGVVDIGDNNVFRSFVTVDSGTNESTMIGDNCLFLRGSHVGHDAKIQDKANISCSVLIGGHTIVMEGANLGLGAIIHQRQVIGAYSMVGMGTIVTKKCKIHPGGVYVGNPSKYLRNNDVGLARNNINAAKLHEFDEKWYKLSRGEE